MNEIIERLSYLKDENLYREEIILEEVKENKGKINGKEVVIFNSNDYLNLESNGENFINSGTGGSRLINGTRESHKSLEKVISKFFDREDTILFNTGYNANLGTIQAICDAKYVIFSDELNHASIIDGCKLAKGKKVIYKHNNIKDLEDKIKKEKCKYGLIVTEGVFSMKGDLCRIHEIIRISKKYDLLLMVDDAHGIGVIGRQGILEIIDNKDDIHIYMGSLSKSVGRIGGFISGKREIIDFLRNKSRSYIYSTSLPSYECEKIKENLLKITEEKIRELKENTEYFNFKLKNKGMKIENKSAIFPIFIGNEIEAIEIQKNLIDKGIFLTAIRYPTVKKGEAILRVSIMRKHKKEDIDKLFLEL
ncbi:MAG: aminotransferase class I/II-fold pyridoxal phosphate-dependent enzyme [Clostridium sp.]